MPTDRDPPEGEPGLSEFEAALLGSLAPARGRLDRDRVMYQAGRSSIRSAPPAGRRGWMVAATVFGLMALGEGALLARQPGERVVERVIVLREPAATPAVPPLELVAARPAAASGPRRVEVGPGVRDRLAWQVLRYGLDGLPAPGPSSGGERATSRRSLRQEIGKVLELGDPS